MRRAMNNTTQSPICLSVHSFILKINSLRPALKLISGFGSPLLLGHRRNHEQLQALSDEVGAERSLLVVCSAFRSRKDGYANLTVKKIPKAVLSRCEWGHDDYSLQVENLPKAPPKPGQIDLI